MDISDAECIPIFDRDDIDRVLGTVKQRFDKIKSELYISGNDCKFVVESLSAQILVQCGAS